MQPRKLTESEVTFTIEMEPEFMPFEGQFDDRRDVAFIRKRLAAEQQEAWCMLTVKASWNGFDGFDHLGGVSLDCGQHPSGVKVAKAVEKFARESDMHSQALEDLTRVIAEQAAKLAPLLSDGFPWAEKAAEGAKRMRLSDDLVHMAREHMETDLSKPEERG